MRSLPVELVAMTIDSMTTFASDSKPYGTIALSLVRLLESTINYAISTHVRFKKICLTLTQCVCIEFLHFLRNVNGCPVNPVRDDLNAVMSFCRVRRIAYLNLAGVKP